MKRRSLNGTHDNDNRQRVESRIAGTRANRSGSEELAALRHALDEFDALFREMQQQMRLDDGSDQARLALAAVRRKISERSEAILQQIAPAIIESEYRRPGITEDFHALWFYPPAVIQGETSWLGYLGNIRKLLLDAMGADDPARTTHTDTGSRFHCEFVEHTAPAQLQPGSIAETRETETHFTCKEIAERWAYDESTVRRIFRDEPGVLRIPHLRRHGKRDYTSLRIPASVAARVHERLRRPLFKVQ